MNAAPNNVTALPTGTARHHYDQIGSTNTQAFALQQTGITLPAWVSATHQTDGRGRGANAWQSLPGNLQASYVFSTACDMQHISQLAFVAGLAVRDTVRNLLPDTIESRDLVSLKWPNDILCAGQKLAGILVQTMRNDPGSESTAVIGVGLNIATTPHGLEQPVTSLRRLLGPAAELPSATQTISELDQNLSGWLLRWRDGQGWRDVRTNWIAQNGLFGHRVSVRNGDTAYSGIMKGLDETGALLIVTDENKQQRVTFGDIALV
ncbi:MAG: biotin--[acetyl-CoA-carboxylase] ligase [Pseudomonadota bacterium]